MDRPQGLVRWTVSAHARFQMGRRGISADTLAIVLRYPQQRFADRDGRDVFQCRMTVPSASTDMLVRVFVDFGGSLPEVVTVYQTSKILKYWRSHHES